MQSVQVGTLDRGCLGGMRNKVESCLVPAKILMHNIMVNIVDD